MFAINPAARLPERWTRDDFRIARVDLHYKAGTDRPSMIGYSPLLKPEYAAARYTFVGTSWDDAMHAAISLSRRNDETQAHAILETAAGAYYVTPVDMNVDGGGFGVQVGMGIDGNAGVASVSRAESLDRSVQAIVGGYSWLDLRSGSTTHRAVLPTLVK